MPDVTSRLNLDHWTPTSGLCHPILDDAAGRPNAQAHALLFQWVLGQGLEHGKAEQDHQGGKGFFTPSSQGPEDFSI